MKTYVSTLILVLVAVTAAHNAMAGVLFRASASPSTVTINKPVPLTLSGLNGGSSQLYVTNIQLTATSTSNPTQSRLPMAVTVFNPLNTSVTIGAGPNVSTSIGAGPVVFFSPSTGITGSGSGTYTVGGTVYLSDGSVNPISIGAVVTVNPVPLPAYERQ